VNMGTVAHPHITPHVVMPKELFLYFSGDVPACIPVWSWALMDATDLYASDRGTVGTSVQRTHIWAATVGLGKGCAFLSERKWRGRLTIKCHLRDVGIFRADCADPLIVRCKELLTGIQWTAERVEWVANDFTTLLCNDAYREVCKK
jgi:hypothetical protein